MIRLTSRMRRLAAGAIACHAGQRPSAGSGLSPGLMVCQLLRPHLASLMGTEGFAALFSRALSLASSDAPVLRQVRVLPDGSFDAMDSQISPAAQAEMDEAAELLLGHLLGLLVAFIGETLTVQIVRELFPKLSLGDLDTDKGMVEIRPRQTDYERLITGLPVRLGQRIESAPEPKATR